MKIRILLALAMLLPLIAFARAWKVDAPHSSLTFAGTYQGEKFEGRFKRFDAKIDYDPADLAQSKFDVTVEIASVDTANTERDQALPGKDFFDTAHFPKAHFVTTRFRKTATGRVLADGTLTLHGVARPVVLSVEFVPQGKGAILDVSATLKRLDFGIGGGDWADTSMIGNDVTVRGHLLLTPL